MNVEDYLDSTRLVDCQGRTTHVLTLMLDGRIRVRVGIVEAVIEPATRHVAPPHVKLGRGEYGHDQIVQLACDLSLGRSR